MWIVFIRITGILTSTLEYSRYMYIIYYDILEQVYSPSEDTFSSIPKDDKIKLYDRSRIPFKFKTHLFLWINVCR